MRCSITALRRRPRKWLREQKHLRHTTTLVLHIVPLTVSWGRRNRRANLRHQLFACRAHAHHRIVAIIGPTVHVQHIFHRRYEFDVVFWRNAPALPQMGFQLVSLRVRRTVSYETLSTIFNATSLSASNCSVQHLRPSGGGPHRNAIKWASALPSRLGCREGQPCFLRFKAASSSCWTNRWWMPATVLG